jgi:hypothetical protein
MKSLILSAFVGILAAFGLAACNSDGSINYDKLNTVLTQVVDTALPIAANLGSVAAQSYVSGLVSDGTLTQDQATAINEVIASTATSIASSVVAEAASSAAATTETKALKSKAISKSLWLSSETKAEILAKVKAKLGVK